MPQLHSLYKAVEPTFVLTASPCNHGPGESLQMRRLARVLPARIHKVKDD